MEFVDTHCHLDDDAFANDLPQVIDAARAAGVRRFVNIGYEPESWIHSIQLAAQFPDISYALGMHPNSADRWTSDTAAELASLLSSSDAVAIGETGLDFYREWVDRSSQRAAFRDQLELAQQFSLPIVIHMRGDVEDEIVTALTEFRDVRCVFHSFDGSAALRDFALRRGDLVGVGGLMTRASQGPLREILSAVPLESLVLETDSPYLVPKSVKERRNTSASLPIIASSLAELLGVSVDQVAEQTTANAIEFFSLHSGAATGAMR